FFVFAALILWMFYQVAYVPGGQAIGWLENGFAKITKRIGKLFSARRPGSQTPLSEEPASASLAPAE
ncbi:MAG: LPS export ABC transporter permease LptF, partial [Pseudomonadota bacterium]